jgi:hypothetical protein
MRRGDGRMHSASTAGAQTRRVGRDSLGWQVMTEAGESWVWSLGFDGLCRLVGCVDPRSRSHRQVHNKGVS